MKPFLSLVVQTSTSSFSTLIFSGLLSIALQAAVKGCGKAELVTDPQMEVAYLLHIKHKEACCFCVYGLRKGEGASVGEMIEQAACCLLRQLLQVASVHHPLPG